jgi:hypothetical protein
MVMPSNSATRNDARDNGWLTERLKTIRSVHFADVAHGYPIEIRFGTRARYRFGSIAARKGKTIILINRLFADTSVPDYVIDSTIAHEMAHYAHGFGSGLPRLFTDPHRGGVVDRELERRGLTAVTQLSEDWRKANWEPLYSRLCGDIEARREFRLDESSERWQQVLGAPNARSEQELRERLHVVLKRIGALAGSRVFEVQWLEATTKQCGTSYWFQRTGTVRLHGLLADRRVPDCVVEFELAYWAMRHRVGSSWPAIHLALQQAGFGSMADEALRWRRSSWTSFRRRRHPLNAVR